MSIPPTDSTKLSADTMYVCFLSEALSFKETAPDCSFICIQDRFLSASDIRQLKNMILVKENISLGNLFSILMEDYNQILEWERRSDQALLKGCDYQLLLDLAEAIIPEPIYVMDSTFKLLANSKNISSPDPMTVSLEKYGRHTDETIELFRQHHSLEKFSSDKGFIIDEPDPAQFPTITKCFDMNKKTELIVTLVAVNEEISDHLLELFGILTEFIRICFKSTIQNSLGRNTPQEAMLYQLIYEESSAPFSSFVMAKSISFPSVGNFVIFRMMYDGTPNVLFNQAVDQFRSLFPAEHIFSHNYEMTMLCVLDGNDTDEQIRNIADRLKEPLKKHNMICGISPLFTSLQQIRTASENATTALSFGRSFFRYGRFFKIPENIWMQFTHISNDRLYFFNDLIDYICISWYLEANETLTTDSVAKIKNLIQYDKDHNSFLTLILLCYLMNGKRATDTGAALFTHRNNIVYGIRKISDLLSVDFNDTYTCEKLYSAFRFLAVASANKGTKESELA